jgi:Ca2+-transporting ATPase
MFDPPREEVKETIAKCHRAGIRVIMITGDHPSTARAVAEYVGICQPKEKVLDGSHLAKLKFNQLCNEVKTVNVFARVSPTDKINIVKALQHNGQVVSMTGDGVNDSPSLKMADVGVAMGITGTDVAKDAADMILLDDDFNTIEKAIEEGRRIYNNIQKVIAFLVSGNVAEILIILVAAIFTDVFNPTPLTAILILFVNLLTDTIPGIALGLDKASPNLMEYPPIGKKDFLNKKSIFQIIYYGVILAVIALGAFVLGKYAINFGSDEHLIAFTFATLSFTEMALIFCFKSSSISIFSRHLKYNP